MAQIRQEMPPPGGYDPITWARIPLRSTWSNATRYALYFGVTTGAFLIFKQAVKKQNMERIELRCSRIALTPMVLAERDRMFLNQLRKNRDSEEELMKDVAGWEVGKWKKYPVYLTLDPNEFIIPEKIEYYVHADPSKRSDFLDYKAN